MLIHAKDLKSQKHFASGINVKRDKSVRANIDLKDFISQVKTRKRKVCLSVATERKLFDYEVGMELNFKFDQENKKNILIKQLFRRLLHYRALWTFLFSSR